MSDSTIDIRCANCDKEYDPQALESIAWVARGPEDVTLASAIIYCDECWSEDS